MSKIPQMTIEISAIQKNYYLKELSKTETISVLNAITKGIPLDPKKSNSIILNTHLLVDGEGKDFCLFFADLCKENSWGPCFTNDNKEVAHFISSKIKFNNSTSNFTEVYENLTGDKCITSPHISYEKIVLKWGGNNTQLLYVFKKLKSDNKYNCTLTQTLDQIAKFIFSNIEFSGRPVKNYNNLLNILKRDPRKICSKKNRIIFKI